MKTSFYFVVWILMYPILGLFHNPVVDNNAFLIALLAVWGLSWWLNQMMPKTLQYERLSQLAPILEDVYTGNVSSFLKRLTSETRVEIFTGIYFLVSTFVIIYAMLKAGTDDWFALIVFGFFAISVIVRSITLFNAMMRIRRNPTPEQCMDEATEVYQLDYASYYESRQENPYERMLPPRPSHFKAFQIFSIVMAGICALLGIAYIIPAVLAFAVYHNFALGAVTMMYVLYGSLATYFGFKDFFTILRSLRASSKGE